MRRAMLTKGLAKLARAAGAVALCLALVSAAAAAEITVRGRIGRTVEAGGWLVVTPQQKYLLINAGKWKDESWFREGADVVATGTVRADVVTTQMEGTPFEARTLRPAGDGATEGATQAAQTKSQGATQVVVSGDATVHARPDTALITVAVVTQGRTALAAQQENAQQSDAVVRAVKAAMGAGAEVETSGYSLQPQYTYRQNEPPLIQSYQARNGVNVTLADLSKVGAVIDAATAAGANNVDNLSFTLRQDRTARDEALAAATREARRKAQVIAQALGGRVARIIEVQEAGTQPRPVPIYRTETMARSSGTNSVPTPVEIGTLTLRSQVTLVAEITMGQ
ncbi:MAG: SIMPL domain-containing protein [Pyrinomonadaceae bacterium]